MSVFSTRDGIPTSRASGLRERRRSVPFGAMAAEEAAGVAAGTLVAAPNTGRPGRGHDGIEVCRSRLACDDTDGTEGLGTTAALALSVGPSPDRRRLIGCSLSAVPDLRAGRMSELSTSALSSADSGGIGSSSGRDASTAAADTLDEARSAMVRDFGIALPICEERDDSPSQSGLITCEGERASAARKADADGSSFRITESTEALGVPGEFMCDGLGLAALESQPSIR